MAVRCAAVEWVRCGGRRAQLVLDVVELVDVVLPEAPTGQERRSGERGETRGEERRGEVSEEKDGGEDVGTGKRVVSVQWDGGLDVVAHIDRDWAVESGAGTSARECGVVTGAAESGCS